MIKSSGKTSEFTSGSRRDSLDGKPRMELLPYDLLSRVAVWYGLGATKYGDNNWRMGQKQSHVLGSLMRHLDKYIRGESDEDHLSAVIWNALCLMNVDTYHSDNPSLSDLKTWFKNGVPTGKGAYDESIDIIREDTLPHEKIRNGQTWTIGDVEYISKQDEIDIERIIRAYKGGDAKTR